MLSAEDIISLEKKWFRYKIKQKMIYFIITLLLLGSVLVCYFIFLSYSSDKFLSENKNDVGIMHSTAKISPIQNTSSSKSDSNLSKDYVSIVIPDLNKTTPLLVVNQENVKVDKVDLNISKENSPETKQPIEKPRISYYQKIIPTLKTNDLFSSSGTVTFHTPISNVPTVTVVTEQVKEPEKATHPKKEIVQEKPIDIPLKPKKTINISTEEVDTITYLKEKFYSTENIVFAIMLSEELYNKKDFEESIKWALTANEIDSKNDKSWYWFAKNKIQLNQKDDAIKALKAFLAENNSTRLKSLLKEIESGDK